MANFPVNLNLLPVIEHVLHILWLWDGCGGGGFLLPPQKLDWLFLSSSSFLQCCLQPTLPDVYETQSSVQPPVEKQTDNYVPVWTKKQKAHLSLVLFTNHGPGNNVAKEDIKSDNRNRRLYIYLGLLLPPHKNVLFGGTFLLPGPVYLSWKCQNVIFLKFLLKQMFNCTLQKNKVLIWYFRDKT